MKRKPSVYNLLRKIQSKNNSHEYQNLLYFIKIGSIIGGTLGIINLALYTITEDIPFPLSITQNPLSLLVLFALFGFISCIFVGFLIFPSLGNTMFQLTENKIIFPDENRESLKNYFLIFGLPLSIFILFIYLTSYTPLDKILENHKNTEKFIFLCPFFISPFLFLNKKIPLIKRIHLICQNIFNAFWLLLLLSLFLNFYISLKLPKSFLYHLFIILISISLFLLSWLLTSINLKKTKSNILPFLVLFLCVCYFPISNYNKDSNLLAYKITKKALYLLKAGGGFKTKLYLNKDLIPTRLENILEKNNSEQTVTIPLYNILSIGDTIYLKDKQGNLYSIKKEFVMHEDFLSAKKSIQPKATEQ